MTATATRRLRFILQPVDDRAGNRDLPLLSVSQHRGVVPRSLLTSDDPRADDLSIYKVCRPGDIVVNRMSAYQGALGRSDYLGIVSPDYLVMRPLQGVDSRWLHHLMRSTWFVSEMSARIRGIGSIGTGNVRTPRVSAEEIGDIAVPLPTPEAQRAIADVLDAEATRIDALITQRRRMLALLAERRRALLSSAVAGGFVHSTEGGPTSDWYGTLPQGWHVSRIGRVTRLILDGPHVSPSYVEAESGIPFLSVRNIRQDGLDWTSAKYISESDYQLFSRRLQPRRGDVLLTKGGTTGIALPVLSDRSFQVWVHVAVLRPDTALVDSVFLAAVLNSAPGYEQSQLLTRGATNQDLALGRIAKIEIPLPPLDLQRRIAQELSSWTAIFLQTTQRLERQTTLLNDRRNALITSVVTGEAHVPEVAA